MLLFIVLHVLASLICIFLASRQLVLFSTLPKRIHSFLWSQMVHVAVLKNFISIDIDSFLPPLFFLRVQISLAYKRVGRARALYTSVVEHFWTKVGLISVVYKSQNFRKFCWCWLNILSIFIGNFTTKIFKILCLL